MHSGMKERNIYRTLSVIYVLIQMLLLFAGCSNTSSSTSWRNEMEDGVIDPQKEAIMTLTAEEYTYEGVDTLRRIARTDTGFLLVAEHAGNSVILNLDDSLTERDWVREEYVDDYVYDIASQGETVTYLKGDGVYRYNKRYGEDLLFEAKGDTLFCNKGAVSYVYQKGGTELQTYAGSIKLPDTLPGQTQTIHGMWEQSGKSYLLLAIGSENDSVAPSNMLYSVDGNTLEKAAELTIFGQHFAATENYLYSISGKNIRRTDGNTIWDCGSCSDYLIMESQIQDFLPLEDGRILILWNDILTVLSGEELIEPDEAETGEEGKQKIIILTDSSYIDYRLEKVLNDYQRQNKNCTVGIHYCNDADELGKALVSGSYDMFITSKGLEPTRNLLKQGYITDIRDSLGDLKDGIYENVYRAGTVDGVVTAIPFNFTLEGMAIAEAAMEGRDSFENTIDMETTLLSLSHQNFWMREHQEDALQCFGHDGFESWVNREDGTCDFEDETFLALLRILSRFAPDLDTVEANDNGKNPLFKPRHEFNTPDFNLHYFAEAYKSGKPYSEYGLLGKMIPIPGKDAVTGVSLTSHSLISVMKDCKNPEGVKELLAYLFSEEVQRPVIEDLNQGGFSPVMEIQEAYLTEKLENPPVDYEDGYVAKLPEYTAEVRRLLKHADHYSVDESPVKTIVMEEINRYLAGQVPAEKAAEYIQNRVSIYLTEQG